MAKLEPGNLLEFSAAAAAATLTTSRRLIRNFDYYKNRGGHPEIVFKPELLDLCHSIRLDLFGLLNLLEDPAKHTSPFIVTLANQIHDSFEEIHRKILFYNADLIEGIIPLIDRQRTFWSSYTEESFYLKPLSNEIETNVASNILEMEQTIQTLPESARV